MLSKVIKLFVFNNNVIVYAGQHILPLINLKFLQLTVVSLLKLVFQRFQKNGSLFQIWQCLTGSLSTACEKESPKDTGIRKGITFWGEGNRIFVLGAFKTDI